MYAKQLTYKDYDGNQRTETFYFNLNKAEIAEMELTRPGGMRSYIQNAVGANDLPTLISIFKDLIDKSYGVKSPDGRRFVKNKEVLDEFKQTEAYSEIFMMLATDDQESAKFIQGISPDGYVTEEAVSQAMKIEPGTMPQISVEK